MRKFVLLIVFATAGVSLLFAGGQQEGGSSESGAEEKIELNLWDPTVRPGAKEARDEFIAGFETRHPNIDVVNTVIPWGQINDKLLAAFATDTLPDIFTSWGSFPPTYFEQGITQEVTDVIEEIGLDQFSPAVKRVSATGDRWFAVPWAVVPHVLFYRSDWAEQKGLGAPATWDDWLRMGEAFTEGDRYGVIGYLGDTEPYYLTNIRASIGATTFDKDLNVTINDEKWIVALNYLKQLWEYTQPGATTISQTDARVVFTEGGGGTLATSVSFANVIGQKDEAMLDQIGSVTIPRNPKYESQFGGLGPNSMYFCISKNMEHREAAKMFNVEFMSHENHLAYATQTAIGWVAVRNSVQNSPDYINHPRMAPYKSFIEAAIEATPLGLNLGHPYGPNKYGGAVFGRAVWTRMIQKLIVDGMAPEEIVEWAQEAVEEIKAELD